MSNVTDDDILEAVARWDRPALIIRKDGLIGLLLPKIPLELMRELMLKIGESNSGDYLTLKHLE